MQKPLRNAEIAQLQSVGFLGEFCKTELRTRCGYSLLAVPKIRCPKRYLR